MAKCKLLLTFAFIILPFTFSSVAGGYSTSPKKRDRFNPPMNQSHEK